MSSSSSSYDSSSSSSAVIYGGVIVAMASREYGEGRVLVHTDRLSGVQTGHGANSISFWRGVLEWVSSKNSREKIRVALVVNTQIYSGDRINSFNPISVSRLTVNDLSYRDLSEFDCIYFVGLPSSVFSLVSEKIGKFVEDGGGVVVEYPNRGGEYINVLGGIEDLYLYSSERPLSTFAYWTIEGGNSSFYREDAIISFMSEMRQEDFSNEWTILMTNVVNNVTTTTTTNDSIIDFGQSTEYEFSVSVVVAFQDGIVTIYPGTSSSSSSSESSSSFSSSSSSSSSNSSSSSSSESSSSSSSESSSSSSSESSSSSSSESSSSSSSISSDSSDSSSSSEMYSESSSSSSEMYSESSSSSSEMYSESSSSSSSSEIFDGIIPVMTSDTQDGFTVSIHPFYVGPAYIVFNESTAGGYDIFTGAWYEVQCPISTLVDNYLMYIDFPGGGSPPINMSWSFQASNNGSSWITLHSDSRVFSTAGVKRFTGIGDGNSYIYYRWNVSSATGYGAIRYFQMWT